MLGYLGDRSKAFAVAPRFVSDLIKPFVARSRTDNCCVNVHVVAHSMGAYLFQEAVDESDEHASTNSVSWTISQLLLIGADIDQSAMSEGAGDGRSMLNHATRVTNYSNPYDEALKLSNVKRLGLEPRIGRVGLPTDAPANAVSVDCGNYYQNVRVSGAAPCYGFESHSWHIGDPVWTDDMFLTIQGDWDRLVFPTRAVASDGSVSLQRP
jgi:esterase/lipase superfamily enzyme